MKTALSRKYLLVQRLDAPGWNLMMEVGDKTKSKQLVQEEGVALMNEVISTTISFLVQKGLLTIGEFTSPNGSPNGMKEHNNGF